jgi:hypothetical protein
MSRLDFAVTLLIAGSIYLIAVASRRAALVCSSLVAIFGAYAANVDVWMLHLELTLLL